MFTPGTVEHRNMNRFASQRYISIAVIGLLLALINLINSIRVILQTPDRQGAINILIIGLVLITVISISVIYKLRSLYGNGIDKRSSNRHKREN
jgi:hypothetical protein